MNKKIYTLFLLALNLKETQDLNILLGAHRKMTTFDQQQYLLKMNRDTDLPSHQKMYIKAISPVRLYLQQKNSKINAIS